MKKMTILMGVLALALIAAVLLAACCKNKNVTTCAEEQPALDNGKIIYESIMSRTSVRSYTDRAVSADTVEMLLRAGMAAPTARNSQPWHFVVINDRAKMDEIAANSHQEKMLKESQLYIVVCGDMNKTLDDKAREYWIQDCSAATENILLAAHALGLGAVWTGIYPIDERVATYNELLKLPENLIPLCNIVIGYPAEQPTPKDKWKAENVTYNSFE
jgi:nitroreductase